jgi:hypothetical protein
VSDKLRQRKMARYRALENVMSLMTLPTANRALAFEWDANPSTEDSTRKLIKEEYDSIYWQLCRRYDKLHEELFGYER